MQSAVLTLAVAAASFFTSILTSDVVTLNVSHCAATDQPASVSWDKPLPGQNLTTFPLTQVDVCYTDSSIDFAFTAYNETSFYYNVTQKTNDFLFLYEVLEIFISSGHETPITYFEFEVNPGNTTLSTFVYNPSGERALGTPFDHFIVSQPLLDGVSAKTELDRPNHVWRSWASIPLGYFNVHPGQAKGTEWRMNFGRIVTSKEIWPKLHMASWSPADHNDFHVPAYFGKVNFV